MNIPQSLTYYVRGKLSEEEAIELWVELMKDQELLDQLEIELWLVKYYSE